MAQDKLPYEMPNEEKSCELVSAVFKGDIEKTRILLSELNEKGIQSLLTTPATLDRENTITLLQAACLNGSLEMVKYLVEEAGGEVNQSRDNITTPLISAIQGEGVGTFVAEYLIGRSAEVNRRDESHQTALHHAVRWKNLDILRLLLEKGANANLKDTQGQTALLYAAQRDQLASIGLLILHSADLNLTDKEGQTALHVAVAKPEPQIEIIACLLDAGADINAIDNLGQSPVMCAVAQNRCTSLAALRLLISRGADLAARDCKGQSALHHAGNHSAVDALRCLLQAQVHVDTQDHRGRTVLMRACMYDDVEVAVLCVEAGATLSLKDHEGRTALHLTTARPAGGRLGEDLFQGSHLRMLDLLLEAEGSEEEQKEGVNLVDLEGRTPAHLAVLSNNLPAFARLLDADACLFIQDGGGVSVLDIALAEVEFAEEVLKRPRLLGSLAFVLTLPARLHRKAQEKPSFAPHFNKLAKLAEELALSLLDACCDAQSGHYLISGPIHHSDQITQFLPQCRQASPPHLRSSSESNQAEENTVTALEVALRLDIKPFLSHDVVQAEVLHLWRGDEWIPKSGTFCRSDTLKTDSILPTEWRWKKMITPQRSAFLFDALYLLYLVNLMAYATQKRKVDEAKVVGYEATLYVYMVSFLVKEAGLFARQNWRAYLGIASDNFLDLLICFWMITSSAIRCAHFDDPDANNMYSVSFGVLIVLSFIRVLTLSSLSKHFGAFRLAFVAVFQDVIRFVFLWFVVMLGFAFAMFVLLNEQNSENFGDVRKSVSFLFWALVGSVDLEALEVDSEDEREFGKWLFGVYLLLSSVVMVSFLVSLMSSTHNQIRGNLETERKAGWVVMVNLLAKEQTLMEIAPPLNLLLIVGFLIKRVHAYGAKQWKMAVFSFDKAVLPENQTRTNPQAYVAEEGVPQVCSAENFLEGQEISSSDKVFKQLTRCWEESRLFDKTIPDHFQSLKSQLTRQAAERGAEIKELARIAAEQSDDIKKLTSKIADQSESIKTLTKLTYDQSKAFKTLSLKVDDSEHARREDVRKRNSVTFYPETVM